MIDLSPMTQLAILLTAKWSVNGSKPLTNPEFLELRRWIGMSADAASKLMSGQKPLDDCPIEPNRLKNLLMRGFGVFQPLDKWMQAGLWVRSWSDADYPSRFKQLRLRAPALIFGYGNPEAFSSRAVAIVGSRNASEERLAKTAEIGRACAKADITVVSGGARGVDSTAMMSGIAGGGTVVGVLAESLLKEAGKKNYREAILDNKLCLMSEVNPEARFNIGNAMARNRLAYACADAALVIECDVCSGGTWQGAMEAKREGKAVYVLRGARAERQLAEIGAIVIDIDFALEPAKLITGTRPKSVIAPNDLISEWFRKLLHTNLFSVEILASTLRSDSESIAHQIINLASESGMVPLCDDNDASVAVVDESYPLHKKKKQNLKRAEYSIETLFEDAERESDNNRINANP